jgi:hypothetical protein
VAELVDALDSKSSSARSAGSIPARGTISDHLASSFTGGERPLTAVAPGRAILIFAHAFLTLPKDAFIAFSSEAKLRAWFRRKPTLRAIKEEFLGSMSSIAVETSIAGPVNPTSRVILASLIGTTIEFYDFYVYATAAVLVFPHLFFPAGNDRAALLASFAVFGAAMIARPLGAIFFGHLGDKRGRKITLVGALLTMGIATFLIGLLPTYPVAGWFAPALLVLLRLAQGFALGGEWSGAALVATENAPKGKRAIFGTFPQLGAPLGFIIANGLFLIIAALLPSNDPSRPSDAFLA